MSKFGKRIGEVVKTKRGWFEMEVPRPVGKENVKQFLTYIFRLTYIFNMTFHHSVKGYIQQSKGRWILL